MCKIKQKQICKINLKREKYHIERSNQIKWVKPHNMVNQLPNVCNLEPYGGQNQMKTRVQIAHAVQQNIWERCDFQF